MLTSDDRMVTDRRLKRLKLSWASKSGGGGGCFSSSTPKREDADRVLKSDPLEMKEERDETLDADRAARHELARMIIMHDYPLHMVEHVLQTFRPQFKAVSFDDCLAIYRREKDKLLTSLTNVPGRVCLSLDTWGSSQGAGYVFVTVHFIDSEWKLQRRLLNVVMEPFPNSDTALSHAVDVCLHDWGLKDKLFSITVNHSLGEIAVKALTSRLAIKNPHIFEGQLLFRNCVARTLCAIALDILEEYKELVGKVRDIVKFVKTSDSVQEKFTQLKQKLQVPSERSLSIDDATQWNTTYQMLVAASKLKEVFLVLGTNDLDYKGAPSSNESKQTETICQYLKLAVDAAKILANVAAATKPTPFRFFLWFFSIKAELTRTAAANEDPFSSSLAKTALKRVEEYLKNCGLALATAAVMDPRFKMELVEFSFGQHYGEEGPTFIEVVKDGIRELFHEYKALSPPFNETILANIHSMDFRTYVKLTSRGTKSELDHYLDEYLEEFLPYDPEFDALAWWKLNKIAYPVLSKMAIDILSIPASTVFSDSVFRTVANEMDSYRSSLSPDVIEALLCAKDWMKATQT